MFIPPKQVPPSPPVIGPVARVVGSGAVPQPVPAYTPPQPMAGAVQGTPGLAPSGMQAPGAMPNSVNAGELGKPFAQLGR